MHGYFGMSIKKKYSVFYTVCLNMFFRVRKEKIYNLCFELSLQCCVIGKKRVHACYRTCLSIGITGGKEVGICDRQMLPSV
jgi:hypothetical protein